MTTQFSILPRLLLSLSAGLALLGTGSLANQAWGADDATPAATADAADEAATEATDDEAKKKKEAKEGWVSIFNGEDLEGWKAAENPKAFTVKDGELIVKGNRGHLFYAGEVNKGNFKNFEWKVEVMTKPQANSGLYFHTKYEDEGWPSKGYEVQVNNTHGDPKKTGGLYGVADVIDKSPAKDNVWYTMHIIVKGKRVIVKVNDKVVTDYIEPDDPDRDRSMRDRVLSEGTIAIQAHDPGSVVHFRKIMLKPLPDDAEEKAEEKKDAAAE
jgi:hypothetical protein